MARALVVVGQRFQNRTCAFHLNIAPLGFQRFAAIFCSALPCLLGGRTSAASVATFWIQIAQAGVFPLGFGAAFGLYGIRCLTLLPLLHF